jgi:hypothetical protein
MHASHSELNDIASGHGHAPPNYQGSASVRMMTVVNGLPVIICRAILIERAGSEPALHRDPTEAEVPYPHARAYCNAGIRQKLRRS